MWGEVAWSHQQWLNGHSSSSTNFACKSNLILQELLGLYCPCEVLIIFCTVKDLSRVVICVQLGGSYGHVYNDVAWKYLGEVCIVICPLVKMISFIYG